MGRAPTVDASPAFVVTRRAGEDRWHVVDRSGPTRVGRDAPQPRYTDRAEPWLAMFHEAKQRQWYADNHGAGRVFLAIVREQLDMFGLGGKP